MTEIHPTAIVHPSAVIYPGVKIEEYAYIGALCIIGAPAESKTHEESEFSVIIRKGAKLNGLVTVDSGTHRHTEIKEGAYIMKHCHIGHDAIVHEDTTLSPHVIIGGHAEVKAHSNMGMGSVIHQRCIVPEGCMIGMNGVITKASRLIENGCYVGNPVKWLRYNKRK